MRRAAQVLGVLTQELGVAVAPALDEVVLERLDLMQVASDRLLLVFNLRSGAVRTIFVEVPGTVAADVLGRVTQTLNERLGRPFAPGYPSLSGRSPARSRGQPGGAASC